MNERDTLIQIMRYIATRSDLRAWRQNTGGAVPYAVVQSALTALDHGDISTARRLLATARPIQFGVAGQADLSGITGSGKRLEIEVKSDTGRQRDEQRCFEGMIRRFGGVYVLARSVGDVEKGLEEAGNAGGKE